MSERPEVCFVSPQFPSPELPLNGVTESPLPALLAELGIDSHVIVPLPLLHSPLHGSVRHVAGRERVGDWLIDHPRYVGVPSRLTARPVGKPFEIWSYRRALRRALRYRRGTGPRILHAHSCATAGYALLSLREGAPLVVTVHDNDLQTTAERPGLRRYVARVLSEASHIVYQSPKLQRLGEQLVGRHSCSVIPWGVNVYDGIEARAADAFTVTCVARLVPTKGLDLLVRAFQALLRDVPSARLEIIGEGPQRGELEELILTLGVGDSVTLTGWLHNRGARERVAASSAFVLPSYQEALGVSYLEAMSVRVPVVGVSGQGISHVVEHGRNGLLVPPRDVEAVHEALLSLARDPARARAMGEAGHATFLTGGYDWRGHAEKHALLYRALL